VPVYNTERFLNRCIKSIISQTYRNIEIILVDDGSTDSSAEILEGFAEGDQRIKILKHVKNLGLFKARLTGVKGASGEYIAFVDSDDYINEDFIRSLVSHAVSGGFDIVMGESIHENTRGERWVHAGYNGMSVPDRFGKEVLSEFLLQEGYCFLWHALWNKIYKRSLFERGLEFFDSITGHIVMGEDILFSSVLHYYATSFSKMDFAYYFYVQHSSASTSVGGRVSRFEKNLADLSVVFLSVERFFVDKRISSENMEHFYSWRALYSRFWCDNIKASRLSPSEKRGLLRTVKDVFKAERVEGTRAADNRFYLRTIPFDERYLRLISRVTEHDTVSFDLFDTLLVRRCYRPTDAFYLLNKRLSRYFGSGASFHDIRTLTERRLRQGGAREVTLDEIYGLIGREHKIEQSVIEEMKRAEIECEISLLCPRESVINLMRLARHLEKEVFITSDFYMSGEALKDILAAFGIECEQIIVSSDHGKTKASGELFSVLREASSSSSILHIGDSWESDYEAARGAGIDAHFYPSCRACLMNEISDIESTPSVNVYTEPIGQWISYEHGLEFFEVRTALALAAKRLYDNPYISYLHGSAFNCSGAFMGYLALGMHLFGVSRWLYEKRLGKSGTIHFIARDGYLPKLAYDVLNAEGGASRSNYLYASRKSLLPLLFLQADSWEQVLPLVGRTSVERLDGWLSSILDEDDGNEKTDREKILSELEIIEYINNSLQNRLSKIKKDRYLERIKRYFSARVKHGDCFFDIGYSGRPVMAISELLGESFSGYFVHRTSDRYIPEQRERGIGIECFYDHTPAITGHIREMLFSAQAPSCIGYSDEGEAVASFEKYGVSYAERFAIDEIQRQALEFVRDMNGIYRRAPELFSARSSDISALYEYFLSCRNPFDLDYFHAVRFEDEVYHGARSMSLKDAWQRAQEYYRVSPRRGADVQMEEKDKSVGELLSDKSSFTRALFFLLFDRKLFAKKLKKRFFGEGSDKTL
jgi:glycosyltransferase involved in cell wall biosynthesis/FMN phosphatase YigB (HAD superfamily)